MGRPVCVLLISNDTELSVQLQWADTLARLRGLDLQFVLRIEAPQPRRSIINLNAPSTSEEDPSVTELKKAINACSEFVDRGNDKPADDINVASAQAPSPDQNNEAGGTTGANEAQSAIGVSAVALYFDNQTTVRKMLADEVDRLNAAVFSMARGQFLTEQDRGVVVERARLFEFLPCELILCQGLNAETKFENVAVLERSGSNQQSALALATDLTKSRGSLTAFQVNPDIGPDAHQVGERRLDRFLAKLPGLDKNQIALKFTINDNLQQGVRDLWQEGTYDVLVIPGTTWKPEQSVGLRLGRNIPVVITFAASPVASWARQIVKETLRHNIPQIAREDRVELVDRVQSNAEWNFDFVALMVLAASIAAFGLIQNSAAVVIGAMLVAPLMTPIIGLGLSLVHGNLVLAKLSIRAIWRGIAVAMVAGLTIGLIDSEFSEPTREIFARTRPGIIDIAVAFLSGIAAAYAQSRPNLLAALPGVAIAAALVPPIVASGLLLALWELQLALGAFVLFVINMVAIILASMLVLFAVGIRKTKQQKWSGRVSIALMATFGCLFILSSANTYEVEIAGEIPVGLEESVESMLGPDYKLMDVSIAYDEIGHQLNLDIVGEKPIHPDLAKAVRLRVSEYYGRASRIRLVTRISADEF